MVVIAKVQRTISPVWHRELKKSQKRDFTFLVGSGGCNENLNCNFFIKKFIKKNVRQGFP